MDTHLQTYAHTHDLCIKIMMGGGQVPIYI